MAITAEQQAFINNIAPSAQSSWSSTHIVLPSITIAQGILESRWGKSTLTVQANNLFGIKADKNWTGQKFYINTKEVINGKTVTVNAAFRKYNNWQESIDDHSKFLNTKRYKNIHGNTNFASVANMLKQDGYATDPAYPNKLINIYNTYGLGKYDGPRTLWTVQTGAFASEENAERRKAEMIVLGYNDAFIYHNPENGLHSVQLGSFSIRKNAERRLAEVKAKGIDAFIKEKK